MSSIYVVLFGCQSYFLISELFNDCNRVRFSFWVKSFRITSISHTQRAHRRVLAALAYHFVKLDTRLSLCALVSFRGKKTVNGWPGDNAQKLLLLLHFCKHGG